MLKAKATTDVLFMISQVTLSIDDRHISTAHWYIWSPQKVYMRIKHRFPYRDVRPFVLVRYEALDLLKLAKYGCPFHLVTYMVPRWGS